MGEVLSSKPEEARRMAGFGARGLDCYLRFLDDCLRASQGTWTARAAAA